MEPEDYICFSHKIAEKRHGSRHAFGKNFAFFFVMNCVFIFKIVFSSSLHCLYMHIYIGSIHLKV